ncbi:MAG TPA: 16S rRNA processing protein RimM [Firmicutes bacterium]|nr:16S rRNA processing protein RimM [Bacillota bacterium]
MSRTGFESIKQVSEKEYAIIGKILRPFGIKGDLIFQTVDDRRLYEHINKVAYITEEGLETISIIWRGMHRSRSIIHLEGVDSRSSAEGFRNTTILVKIKELPELPENEYYEFELVDKNVISEENKILGKIDYVIYTGGTDVLVLSDGTLVPFCEYYIIEITDEYVKLKIPKAENG